MQATPWPAFRDLATVYILTFGHQVSPWLPLSAFMALPILQILTHLPSSLPPQQTPFIPDLFHGVISQRGTLAQATEGTTPHHDGCPSERQNTQGLLVVRLPDIEEFKSVRLHSL